MSVSATVNIVPTGLPISSTTLTVGCTEGSANMPETVVRAGSAKIADAASAGGGSVGSWTTTRNAFAKRLCGFLLVLTTISSTENELLLKSRETCGAVGSFTKITSRCCS